MMDFSQIYGDIQSVFQFMIAELKLFFGKIGSYQLVVFALIVVVALPSFYVIFEFISSAAHDSDEVTENTFSWYRFFNYRRNVVEGREVREKFNSVKHFKDYEISNKMAKDFFKEYPYRRSVKIKGFTFLNKKYKPKYHSFSKSSDFNSDSAASSKPKKRVVDTDIDIQRDDEE